MQELDSKHHPSCPSLMLIDSINLTKEPSHLFLTSVTFQIKAEKTLPTIKQNSCRLACQLCLISNEL